jgi:hypothetical protein
LGSEIRGAFPAPLLVAKLSDEVETDFKSDRWRDATEDVRDACREVLSELQRHKKEAHPNIA